jgi:hypothetical protein
MISVSLHIFIPVDHLDSSGPVGLTHAEHVTDTSRSQIFIQRTGALILERRVVLHPRVSALNDSADDFHVNHSPKIKIIIPVYM